MLATAGVFKAPVIGTVARRIGFIPVDRGAANAADTLGPAADALAAGELVAIFPEGRLTRDPDRWPEKAKTGAVRLALRTGAPIVPVALEGAHRVVGRRKLVTSLLKNVILRPKVATAVGEPIDVRALLEGPETPDEIRRLTDVVWSRLIDLVEQTTRPRGPTRVRIRYVATQSPCTASRRHDDDVVAVERWIGQRLRVSEDAARRHQHSCCDECGGAERTAQLAVDHKNPPVVCRPPVAFG